MTDVIEVAEVTEVADVADVAPTRTPADVAAQVVAQGHEHFNADDQRHVHAWCMAEALGATTAAARAYLGSATTRGQGPQQPLAHLAGALSDVVVGCYVIAELYYFDLDEDSRHTATVDADAALWQVTTAGARLVLALDACTGNEVTVLHDRVDALLYYVRRAAKAVGIEKLQF